MAGLEIREMNPSDASFLVELYKHLGYPTAEFELKGRLEKLLSHEDYCGFVAVEQGKICGAIGLSKGLMFEFDGCYLKVAMLVVGESMRGRGIGKRLMEKAEKYAKSQGALSVTLNSGNRAERKKAHEFYEHLGYLPKSLGFSKDI